MDDPSLIDDSRAKRNVWVLVVAQAFLGSQITMIFVVGGLAGTLMAPNPCFATLPISLIVFGSMSTAPWLSPFMQRNGRRAGFLMGATGGLVGAALGAYAIMLDNFWLFLVGSYFTGVYMSAQGFYRFAATDTASEAFRPKAISYVMAGGLVSAVIGPQIVAYLSLGNVDATPTRYLNVYYVAMAMNLVGLLLFFGLDIPKPSKSSVGAAPRKSWGALLRQPKILSAVIIAAVSYSLMNLVMTSTPLAVVACGYTEVDASNIVTGHVLAMFAPSFFTGHLISRFGVERIVGIGLTILGCAAIVALLGIELMNFYLALILLGLGWNFGFIGATTMLAAAHGPEDRGAVQGMNDMIVFGAVTLASLASGGLMNCSGGSPAEGWAFVNIAMVPFLILAFGALVWLARKPAPTAAE